MNGMRGAVALDGGIDQEWMDGREGTVYVEWRNMAER